MLSRIVSIVALMAMLSACAGGARDVPAATTYADSTNHLTESARYDEDAHERDRSPSFSEKRRYNQYHHADEHYHNEPTPSEVYAGQIALALSAQVFACAFFVVILDGSCNFYASTGYYY